jgi:Tfp pilus assembly protein PilX
MKNLSVPTLVTNSWASSKNKQSGIVLFIALIALVVMSLAAVALIRSTDTNTLIAGNLAFKQSATSSADSGVETAVLKISAIRNSSTLNVINNANHPLNKTDFATNPGYHSMSDGSLDLFATSTWNNTNSVLVGTDNSGNEVRYLIERMCRFADTAIQDADCLLSTGTTDTSGAGIKLNDEVCDGDGCPTAGQSPLFRITARVAGPRNSTSYVQAIVH